MNFKKFIKIVSMALVISITVLGGVFAANYVMNAENVAPESGLDKIKGKRVNILLMATDKGGLLTDTMMLASFDKDRNMLNMLSIPRDTKVKLDNKNYYQKMNSVYGSGEKGKRHELVIKEVKELTGLPVNYYVVINPDVFVNVIDILGGVEINVPKKMYYSDPAQGLLIDLKPGVQVLSGKQAEGFCRYRSGYADADLGRIKAQQMFMQELLKQKLKPQYILKAKDIYDEVIANVDTNIGITDITTLLSLAKIMDSSNVSTYTLPGAPKTEDTSYYICNKAETDKLIDEVFLNNPVPSESATPTSTTGKK